MALKKPRGTQDFLPVQTKQWNYVEKKIREICEIYGFGEIRTPIFEDTGLFLRGIGETTDVVQKEMYTFSHGEKGQSYTLRPENTASAVRAYLENKIYGQESVTKWFYIGPMFRHDRPQAGRYRQFHQFGVEVLGSFSPMTDGEVICMAMQLFKELGLQDLKLQINSVGCPKCRPVYRERLLEFFRDKQDELCHDCQSRLEKNPMRLLDCKIDSQKEIFQGAPEIHEHLCEECREHFEAVKQYLTAAGIEFEINPRLVRGLDYYTKTAFEIQYQPLGAQSAIGGGGRYDGLVEELDGPATPGIGFAIGMERLMLALEKQALSQEVETESTVFVLAMGEAAQKQGFAILQQLRARHIACEMDMQGKSMKSQMKLANKIQAKYVIILGDDELSIGKATLRNMENSEQEQVDLVQIVEKIDSLVKG